MPQTDLQLGGAYIYQWECGVLLALNYLFDTALKYSPDLHQLIEEFLGQVEAIHLEGKTRDEESVDLEDINLISGKRVIYIQVRAKEAEGKWWVPSDPLLAKALYRFYCNKALDQDELSVRFVFLSNRGFNPQLARLKAAIAAGTVAQSQQAEHLLNQVQRYVTRDHSTASPLGKLRFNQLLSGLTLIEFLSVSAVEASIQNKLQGLGMDSWREASEHLYTRFSKGSVRKGGIRITGDDLIASLEPFSGELLRLRVLPVALFQLRPDIIDFTGRHEQLAQVTSLLEKATEAEATAVVISAVAGMPGVGKSALATHVAHRLKDHFPDAQLYVNLRGADGQPLDPFNVLARFLRALGVEDEFIPESLQERASLYRSRLADRQALVLLDNAHDEAQLRPLLPGSPSCAVLVTSRRRLSALEGATVIDLKVMPYDEALELLGRLAGTERVQSDLERARKIVSLCGRLPLAIRIAGGKLRDRPHWNLEDYASRLDDERQRLGQLQLGDLNVRASFALSYQDLILDDARLFRLLAVAGDVFSAEMAAGVLGVELNAAWEALERLVDLQLLEPAGDERYRFHDLMRLFAQERLEQEESPEEQQAARSRAERWYLTAPEAHFYSQAGILDRYVHSATPSASPEMLEAILAVLETRADLRKYFFRSRPSAAWAHILWERSFFDNPPPPQETESGYVLRHWDVQGYLISVAAEVPDVVVNVAESIEGHGLYISQAIWALCEIPGEQAEKLLPKITEWLDDPQISRSIAREVANLVIHLAQEKRRDAAFDLLHALTAPIPPSDIKSIGEMKWGAEAAPKFLDVLVAKRFLERDFPQVAALDPGRAVAILQEHLCTAIHLEAEALDSPDFETRSWWRSAIEHSEQDILIGYKHQLLRGLRDSLETWVQEDAKAAAPVLRQYLGDEREILRRLGLHILHSFPATYPALVSDELGRFENLDDTGIHHEFFMLMQKGFPYVDVANQTALIAAIYNGPPPARVKKFAEWASQKHGIDAEDYLRASAQCWIRDRLWMLKDYLSGKPAETLRQLVEAWGSPEHPEFTRWSGGVYSIRDVAPIEEQELARMSPEELVTYVHEWEPDPQQAHGPEPITYKGLANAVTNVILAAPQRYEDQVAPVVLFRPEFAYALLDHAREGKPSTSEEWEFAIGVCETLLEDQDVGHDMTHPLDVSWTRVRLEIVLLIQLGLNNEQCRIPTHLLPRVRDILLVLLDDADPDNVRPRALLALIEYARLWAQIVEETGQEARSEESVPTRLEPVVRDALTRKLDRREDPSWVVHSAYGHHLPLLFWLDQEWVETHIDVILPEGEDEDSVGYYMAAWEAYVTSNHFWPSILELLRTKYEKAIHNLSRGWVTLTHADPERDLAAHVVWEYLLSEYDLNLPAGPQNLIKLLFQEAPPQARGHVPWVFWRVLEENPSKAETYWPRVRVVWEWRAKEALAANYSTDFADEMEWFAHLLPVAPGQETIASLWPLLEGLLPYIPRSNIGGGWSAAEKYLAADVDGDPVRAIKFYRLLHEQAPRRPEWYHAGEEATKIIEKAADCKSARQEVLSLIDLLARRWDIHQFRYVYDRLHHT